MRDKLGLVTLCMIAAVASGWIVLSLERGADHAPAEEVVAEAEYEPKLLSPPRLAIRRSDRLPVLTPHVGEPSHPDLLPSVTEEQAFETEVEIEVDGVTEQASADSAADENWTAETKPAREKSGAGPRLSAMPPQRATAPKSVASGTADKRTVSLEERIAEISPSAEKRLTERFVAAGAAYPPADISLIAIKDEKVLELHARRQGGEWQLVHAYPVLAASGKSGPKLKRGDKQVPEGLYEISFLNPNSKYHVALRVNYPNSFDKEMAERDGRKELGGDIMIHGKNVSVGCLAVGDKAAEELFVLAEKIGIEKIKLVIAPTDFRRNGIPEPGEDQPKWVPKLYTEVASAMAPYKPAPRGMFAWFSKW